MDGHLEDLAAEVPAEAKLEPVLPGSPEALNLLRHSTAHVMAEAVRQLFPGVKVAIGPAIEDGFYYDFEYTRPFTPDDLPALEAQMAELVKADHPFRRSD